MPPDSSVIALATQLVRDPEHLTLATAERALDLGIGAAIRLLHRERRPGESLEALFARLGPVEAGKLEADCMLLLDGISEASQHAILILLYHSLVSGRWAHEARKADLSGDFRSYIYWLLCNPFRPGGAEFKRRQVSRWLDTCFLVEQLYLREGDRYPWRDRFGLDEGSLPASPDESLALHGDRWGRGAYSLLGIARQLKGTRATYAGLKALIDEGRLDPDGDSDGAHLWRLITHWRFVFGVMADPSQSQHDIDRAAAGSQQLAVPPLLITQEVTPAQRAALKRVSCVRFPDEIFDRRTEVRYMAELLPVCPACEPLSVCSIRPRLDGTTDYVCPACGEVRDGQSYTERWWVRWQTEAGMTPWHLAERPALDDWTPSTIAIAGIRAMVYTTWQDPDSIFDLEARYAAQL